MKKTYSIFSKHVIVEKPDVSVVEVTAVPSNGAFAEFGILDSNALVNSNGWYFGGKGVAVVSESDKAVADSTVGYNLACARAEKQALMQYRLKIKETLKLLRRWETTGDAMLEQLNGEIDKKQRLIDDIKSGKYLDEKPIRDALKGKKHFHKPVKDVDVDKATLIDNPKAE